LAAVPETGIPVNYDEAKAGGFDLPDPMHFEDGCPVRTPADRERLGEETRAAFARLLYGELPPPADATEVVRRRLPCRLPRTVQEELTLTLRFQGRTLVRRASLWRPSGTAGPVPAIVGLSFSGAAGVADDLLDEATADRADSMRWPVPLMTGAGYALLVSGHGHWTPDDPQRWGAEGLWPFLKPEALSSPPGAISLWSWALMRMIDALSGIPEIDISGTVLAGHSRLGKAALWAAVNDPRVTTVLVNEAGCAGSALSRRNFGETLAHITARFPYWFTAEAQKSAKRPEALPVDQHQLLACMAPRRLYVSSATEDLWADPRGEYLGLRSALPCWRFEHGFLDLPEPDIALRPGNRLTEGPIGWHFRPGRHDITPWDWARFLEFLTRNRAQGKRSTVTAPSSGTAVRGSP